MLPVKGGSSQPCAGGCQLSQYGYDADGVQIADLGSHTRILFEDLFVWEQDTGTAISTIYAMGRSLGERHRTGASLRTAWLPPSWEPPVDPWLLAWLAGASASALLAYLAWRSGAVAAAVRRPLPVSVALLLGVQLGLPLEAVAGGGGSAPARRWTFQDHLGNQVLYLNETPEVIYRRVFEPYGGIAAESTGSGSNERIFTGKREDVDTRDGGSGLTNFGARWYDADIGRFLSIDPIVQTVSDPQTHNPYGYVRNNPVTLIDPDGRGWYDFLQIAVGAWAMLKFFGTPLMALGLATFVTGLAGALGGTAGQAIAYTGLAIGTAAGIYGALNPDWRTVAMSGSPETGSDSDDDWDLLKWFRGGASIKNENPIDEFSENAVVMAESAKSLADTFRRAPPEYFRLDSKLAFADEERIEITRWAYIDWLEKFAFRKTSEAMIAAPIQVIERAGETASEGLLSKGTGAIIRRVARNPEKVERIINIMKHVIGIGTDAGIYKTAEFTCDADSGSCSGKIVMRVRR